MNNLETMMNDLPLLSPVWLMDLRCERKSVNEKTDLTSGLLWTVCLHLDLLQAKMYVINLCHFLLSKFFLSECIAPCINVVLCHACNLNIPLWIRIG